MDVVLFSMPAMNFCQDYRKRRPRNLNLKTSKFTSQSKMTICRIYVVDPWPNQGAKMFSKKCILDFPAPD